MGIEQTVRLSVGDTNRPIDVKFFKDGTAFVWGNESVSEVLFTMTEFGATIPTINLQTGATQPNGVLRYQPILADVDTAGEFVGKYKVSYIGGGSNKFPPTNDLIISIED